jgi:hypothetical protein
VYYPVRFGAVNGADEEKLVHYTRILELHGDTLPRSAASLAADSRYWGISVLQRAEERLRTLGSALGSIAPHAKTVSPEQRYRRTRSTVVDKQGLWTQTRKAGLAPPEAARGFLCGLPARDGGDSAGIIAGNADCIAASRLDAAPGKSFKIMIDSSPETRSVS